MFSLPPRDTVGLYLLIVCDSRVVNSWHHTLHCVCVCMCECVCSHVCVCVSVCGRVCVLGLVHASMHVSEYECCSTIYG